MGLINFDRGALSGDAIVISSTAAQSDVVDAIIGATQEKPSMFSKRWGYGCRLLDPARWTIEVGREVGLVPGQVLAVLSHRPDLEHEIIVLDFDGSTGLAFFVDGFPDMKMVSFGRGQAKGVAKAAVASLRASGHEASAT
jgi:hypothetical protein